MSEDILNAEVLRLRSEVQRLRAREAALVEITKMVAHLGVRPWANQDFVADFSEWCAWCGATREGPHPEEHTPDCPVTKARALLAPGAQAVEGEA